MSRNVGGVNVQTIVSMKSGLRDRNNACNERGEYPAKIKSQ